MAYNLQTLITILEKILNPEQTRWILDHKKPQLESLLDKTAFLQQILEKSPVTKIESLESQIRDAAYEAEDKIESHMVAQMLSDPDSMSLRFSTPDLRQVTQELDSVTQAVIKLIEEKTMPIGSSLSGVSSSHDLSSTSIVDGVGMQQLTQELDSIMEQLEKLVIEEDTMPIGSSSSGANSGIPKAVVGLDDALLQLKDRLFGMKSKREIVPIVGMGGIGKTTLARKLYHDPAIVDHFQYRAWATVSQDCNMRVILLGLLGCTTKDAVREHLGKKNHELRDLLHERLNGERYLIVLDDMWSADTWYEVQHYLRDCSNRSRIIVTTRELDVAKCVSDPNSVHHQMQFLSESTSWDLLRQIVFGETGRLQFIPGIGKKIARDCRGLPLSINVIGGVLSKVQRSIDVWEDIAKDVGAAIVESDERVSNILSLSYGRLPIHLKPCFLYVAAFPEDYEIEASKLVHLWVSEGFVKSDGDKSLKEEAEDYLKALVERNLLLVRSYKRHSGKPKILSIHDLVRELCMTKAYEDKFLHVKHEADKNKSSDVSNSRHVSVHATFGVKNVHASAKLMTLSHARSYLVLSKELHRMNKYSFFSALRLVRELDLMDLLFKEFPEEILKLVNLRFLGINCNGAIPSGISRLWNLQTLIALVDSNNMPVEIWELSELRHLELVDECIWFDDESVKLAAHKKLQRISLVGLTPLLIENGFLEAIRNIKDLGIFYTDIYICFSGVDLSHLDKLQTLRCECKPVGASRCFWSTLKFPLALRKLTLRKLAIFPSVSRLLCALPKLEMLEIRSCGFKNDQAWEASSEDEEMEEAEDEQKEVDSEDEDEEWKVAEGDIFPSLQLLTLGNLKLKHWRADKTNFPKLRHLFLITCNKLEEIASDFADIPSLRLIDILLCSDSVVASAKEIQVLKQSHYADYNFKLRIVP